MSDKVITVNEIAAATSLSGLSMLALTGSGDIRKVAESCVIPYGGVAPDINNLPKKTAIYAINDTTVGDWPLKSNGGAMLINWCFLNVNRVQLLFYAFVTAAFMRNINSSSETGWTDWYRFTLTRVETT